MSGSSSRLKELHERLQLRSRESPARAEVPPDLERATGLERGDRKLQEKHGGQIPPAQPHGLERGAADEKGLFS